MVRQRMNKQSVFLKRPCRQAQAWLAFLLAGLLLPLHVTALPEDASQPLMVEASSSELYLDQGLIIYHGTAATPARITQGSLMISGIEIRIQQGDAGILKIATATGTPARFQQQPAVDEAIIYANGLTLTFDNSARLLTVDENAELLQSGNTLTGHHIDYDMNTRRANATSRSPTEPVIMVMPQPPAAGN